MITVEAWTTIRYLHAQGKSMRLVARELGVSRNTVRAALRSDHPPKYTRPPRPNPQLAPFAEQIKQMRTEKQFIGTRILRELRAMGYQGSASALFKHLRELRHTQDDGRVTMRLSVATQFTHLKGFMAKKFTHLTAKQFTHLRGLLAK